MGFLDGNGLSYFWGKVQSALAAKQTTLTGLPGQVVGFDASGTAKAMPGWSNRNLLDNWYFADPINQRGKSMYGEEYTIDRWKAAGSTDMIVSIHDGFITVKTYSKYNRLIQNIERYNQPLGKMVTLSLLVKGVPNSALRLALYDEINVFIDGQFVCDGTLQLFTVTGTIPLALSGNSLWFMIYPYFQDGGLSADLYAAKLELGARQTLAHRDADGNWVLNDPPPDKALELAKCQRYQQIYNGNGMIGQAHAYSGTKAYLSIMLPTVLRHTPTISMEDADLVIVTGSYAAYGVKVTELTDTRMCNNCLSWSANTAGGLTAGRDYNVYLTSGTLIIDANL